MSKISVKIHTVAPRYKEQLRTHNVQTAKTPKERMDALGRDAQGRIQPLVKKDGGQAG